LSEGRSKVASLVAKEGAALKKIGAAFLEYRSDKNISEFKKAQTQVFAVIDSCHTSLDELSNQSVYGPDLLKKIKTIQLLLKERLQLVKSHQELVLKHFEAEAKGSVSDEKRTILSKVLAQNEKKLNELEERIAKKLMFQ
jgi:hypothetical protein